MSNDVQPSVVDIGGGNYIPVSKDTIKATPKLLMDTMAAHLHAPMDPDDPNGRTMLDGMMEIHVREAMTDNKVRQDILDRFCGKATQQVVSTNVNLTMEDFLKQLADEDADPSPSTNIDPDNIIDVEDVFDV